MRYREGLDLSLKDISLKIVSTYTSKGRTSFKRSCVIDTRRENRCLWKNWSGKIFSSFKHLLTDRLLMLFQLLLALFRIIEPSSGTIYIDGINIMDVGLHKRKCNNQVIATWILIELFFCSCSPLVDFYCPAVA